MIEWIKAITWLVFAIALLILAGCLLYLFGVPPIVYLVFFLGVAVGVVFMLNFFFVFILWKFQEYEQEEDYENYVDLETVGRLSPQPQLREAIENQQCQFVVWRDIGRADYLQEIDRDTLTALFSSDPSHAKVFHSFTEASTHANIIWMLYGCQYEVYIGNNEKPITSECVQNEA